MAAYLANAAGPVSVVLDLRIDHDRFGSSSDLNLNGHLHYPNDIDQSLNEVAVDKIRKYKIDNFLAKTAALRITLNIDGAPLVSRSHVHRSHSQTSRLLTSSLSLGVPVPRGTQCM